MSEEKAKTKSPESTSETTAQKQEQQGPDLTVQDLQALKNIIDVASSRGTFKPSEMTVVGTVYTKLETFLHAVASQSK